MIWRQLFLIVFYCCCLSLALPSSELGWAANCREWCERTLVEPLTAIWAKDWHGYR